MALAPGKRRRPLRLEELEMYEYLNQPMWVFDLASADLRVRWANEAAAGFWGVSSVGELTSRPLRGGPSAANKQCMAEHLERILAGDPEQREPETWTFSVMDSVETCGDFWFPAAVQLAPNLSASSSTSANDEGRGNGAARFYPGGGSAGRKRANDDVRKDSQQRPRGLLVQVTNAENDGNNQSRRKSRRRAADARTVSRAAEALGTPRQTLSEKSPLAPSEGNDVRVLQDALFLDAFSVCVLLLSREGKCVLQNPAAVRVFGDLQLNGEIFSSVISHPEQRRRFGSALMNGEDFADVVSVAAYKNSGAMDHLSQPADVILGKSDELRSMGLERERRWFVLESCQVSDPITGRSGISAVSATDVTDTVKSKELMEQFLLNMTHEIRTPITGVLGSLEILSDQKERLSPAQLEALETANLSGHLLGKVINNILVFGKASHVEEVTLENHVFKLADWLQTTLSLSGFKDALRSGDVTLKSGAELLGLRRIRIERPDEMVAPKWVDFAPPPVYVKSDTLRLRQIILNLVENALKFTEKGHVHVSVNSFVMLSPTSAVPKRPMSPRTITKQISASTSADDQYSMVFPSLEEASRTALRREAVANCIEMMPEQSLEDPNKLNILITVEDTGCGIADDARRKIWTAFEQADASTTRRYGGSGLGLAITRELVGAMSGRVAMSSRAGLGSVFAVIVPFERVRGEELESRVEEVLNRSRQDLADDDENTELRVLLVDDNALNVKVHSYMIKKLGHAVDVCTDGLQALRKFDTQASVPHDLSGADPNDANRFPEHGYDLILMDISMPIMDGTSASRAIRSVEKFLGERNPIYISALTAHSLPQHEKMCLDAGMNELLIKPLKRGELAMFFQSLRKQKALLNKFSRVLGLSGQSSRRAIARKARSLDAKDDSHASLAREKKTSRRVLRRSETMESNQSDDAVKRQKRRDRRRKKTRASASAWELGSLATVAEKSSESGSSAEHGSLKLDFSPPSPGLEITDVEEILQRRSTGLGYEYEVRRTGGKVEWARAGRLPVPLRLAFDRKSGLSLEALRAKRQAQQQRPQRRAKLVSLSEEFARNERF